MCVRLVYEEIEDFRDADNFMEIVPVGLFEGLYNLNGNGIVTIGHGLPLKVLTSTGVGVERDFEINVTDLNSDSADVKFKHFHTNGDGGLTFKVDVAVNPSEMWGYTEEDSVFIYNGVEYPTFTNVDKWLDWFYVNMVPLYVVSDAVDVPNGVYLITKNKSRQQSYRGFSIWGLELSTFNPITLYKWKTAVKLEEAIDEVLNPKPAATTTNTTANSTSSLNQRVKNCVGKTTYSTTRNNTECNKVLQEKLNQLGLANLIVDGWYGPSTMEAVKKFQRKYNTTHAAPHQLLVDGLAGSVTMSKLAEY